MYIYFKPTPESLDQLKKMYKKLAFKFHPDHGGSNEDFKAMANEYEKLLAFFVNQRFHFSENSQQKQQEYKQDDRDLRAKLEEIWHLQGITIEIIGNWIWVTGNTYQVKDDLKAAKFRFSGKKKAWYWHGDHYKKRSKKQYDLNKIRSIYGSETVKETDKQSKSNIKKS